MSESSFSAHEGGCGGWSGRNDLPDGATTGGAPHERTGRPAPAKAVAEATAKTAHLAVEP